MTFNQLIDDLVFFCTLILSNKIIQNPNSSKYATGCFPLPGMCPLLTSAHFCLFVFSVPDAKPPQQRKVTGPHGLSNVCQAVRSATQAAGALRDLPCWGRLSSTHLIILFGQGRT